MVGGELHKRARVGACLLALTGLFGVDVTVAQTAADATDSLRSDALAEVVVTARKQEENLQSVPVSVTAVSGAEIQAKSAAGLADVLNSSANVSFNTETQNGPAAAVVFIRGIGQSDALLTNDPGVGVYLDGVYLGRMEGLNLETMDVQRVEILRGPQGTLFGRNTIGGAINVVSTQPDPTATGVSGKTMLTGGDFHRIDGMASINVPVVQDQFAVYLAVSSRNQDGYGRSLVTGSDLGNVSNLSGRLSALWRPNETWEVSFNADGTRDHDHSAFYKLVEVDTQAPLIQLLNSLQPVRYDNHFITNSYYTNYAPAYPNFADDELSGESLTITWHTGPVDVKSITAYRHNITEYGQADDAIDPSTFPETEKINQHQISQEFQFNGSSFGDALKWVAGLYYFNEKASDATYFGVFPMLYPLAGLDIAVNKSLPIDNTSYAAYVQGTYALTSSLHLTLGGRESFDGKTDDVTYTSANLGTVIIPFTSKTLNTNDFTPRVGLEYQWSPTLMTYVSAAKGYKTGGFNGRAGVPDEFNQYDPETVWTYEAGVRSDWLDRTLRINATAFYSRYSDIQVNVTAATTGGADASVVQNAAAATIEGGELEIDAVPIKGLKLSANVGLTDAFYTSIGPGVPFTTADRFQDTPKWVTSLTGQYAIQLSDYLVLTPRVDHVYRTTTYHEAVNTPASTQGSYGLLNARLTLESMQNRWSVAAFVTNLCGKEYFTGAIDVATSLGDAVVNPGPPREFGVTGTYRF
jgi:iron complex outermembrane recepter protein